MRKFFTLILIYIGCGVLTAGYTQSSVDTLFCGDKLFASYDPTVDPTPTDSFFVWIGNCLSRIRFDFTTADVPDAADIFYMDINGNTTSAGSMPYFGGNCGPNNYFNDPMAFPLQAALEPQNCLPGFVEIYGQGLPDEDSVIQRNSLPSDFKLQGNVNESARLHLDIPEDIVALLFVVKFNPDQSTVLEALWDCTPSCCITATGDSVCIGEDVQLGTVQEAISYSWTGPNGFTSTERAPLLQNVTLMDEGWYLVKGTYLYDCSGVDSIYVDVRGSEITMNTDTARVCFGASTELTVNGGVSYDWLPNVSGLTAVNGATATVTAVEPVPVSYTVVATDAFGCVDTVSAVLVPSSLKFQLDAQTPSCSGKADGVVDFVMHEGEAPFEIRLSGESWISGTYLSNLPSGDYDIEIRDALGCMVSTSTTLIEPEPIDILVGINDPSCQGACDGEVAFIPSGGVAPFSYLADGRKTDSIATGFCAGTYPLQITDANGCIWNSAFTIEEPAPFSIDLGKNEKIREGETIDIEIEATSQIDSVIWKDICEYNCETRLSLRPDSSTTIIAQAWTASGCMAEDAISIRVKKQAACGDGLYFPNAFSPNADGINEYFTLYADPEESDVEEIQRLTIFNKWGRMVYDQHHLLPGNDKAGWDGTSKGHLLQEGVYTWVATMLNQDKLTYKCSGTVLLLK